jgi:UDP-N-acetylglucosamine acyltransferase
MAQIHPTAIVEPGAELADDVSIGAYAYVGPRVRLGVGCTVHHHGCIGGNTTVGERNVIHPFAFIGGQTQDLKYDGSDSPLIIGAGNVFREYVTVHCPTSEGSETRLGNGNYLLAYAHVAHECVLHDDIIISSKAVLGGHVEVDDRAVVGGGSAVHQFCKIGRCAMLGGLSALVQDLPPYMVAEGNRAAVRAPNRIGCERCGFSPEWIAAVRHVHRLLYASGLNRSQALEKMRGDPTVPEELKREFLSFRERCTRGLV